MKIIESNVVMAAQRQYSSQHQQSLSIRIETPRPQVQISQEAQAKAAQATPATESDSETSSDPKLSLIIQLLEALTGRTFDQKHLKLRDPKNVEMPQQTQASSSQPANEGGFAIDYQEVRTESESVEFQTAGIIKTSDGREIEFSAQLNLSRSFREEVSFSAASGSLVRPKTDPLILNYNAPAATLSADTFAFDLNADGQKENISQLNRGSAYLALDQNHDGQINNGRELFGTQSGDGFADLAAYDQDGNGWIDEGDAVFAKLQLWLKDASGQDQLVDLKSMGIGAIYLGRTRADFSLNDSQNQQLGQIRANGVYLNEDGSGGSLQQIDLVV